MTTTPAPSIGASLLTGSTVGPFATGFKYNAATDVRVWLELAGVRQPDLTLTTDYTLTGANPTVDGGTITLAAGVVPAGGWDEAAGDRVVWARRTVKRQALALPDSEGHKPRATEAVLDKLVRMAEEGADQTALAVAAPAGEAGIQLQPTATREGGLARFVDGGVRSYRPPIGQVLVTDPVTGELAGIAPTFGVDVAVASFPSRLAASLATFPSTMEFVSVAGFANAGDGGQGLFQRVDAEPGHAGKFLALNGYWYAYVPGEAGVNAGAFGAIPNDLYSDTAGIQAAINYASQRGGGAVNLLSGVYLLGTTGLTVYQNIILRGSVGRYGGGTTRGTTLGYSGTAAAIFGADVLDVQIHDLDIDCTDATGAAVRGIHLSGIWKTTGRNVTVRGVTPAKGYGILLDTVGTLAPWGGQHNYWEQIECADGVIRLAGGGPSDGVTTTVFNTVRGYMYQVLHSQVVFMNATAEGFETTGFGFSGSGTHVTMIGCDIEGAGANGIVSADGATWRETGTVWSGYTGAQRVSGAEASTRSYGGPFEFIGELTAGTPVDVRRLGDRNATYVREALLPSDTGGGSQGGGLLRYTRLGGTEVLSHDLGKHFTPSKSVTVAAASAQTLLSIPITNGGGGKVRIGISGIQVGDGNFRNYRECSVMNSGGTLTTNVLAAEVLGVNMSLGFSISSQNLLVVCTPTTANTSVVNLTGEISGEFGPYT